MNANTSPGGELAEYLLGGSPLDDEWLLMIDPEWAPEHEGQRPPMQAIVGGWRVELPDTLGRFEPNPGYLPSGPDSPTDPVDATVRLVVAGERDMTALLASLRGATVGVAVDAQGTPVVAPSPDDVPSLLVTSAPAHRRRVNVPDWAEVPAVDLAEVLGDDGVDVLVNPGAPASVRIEAAAFHAAMTAALA